MSEKDLSFLARKYIHKDKWWDILSKIVDVLRINIFIVDAQGLIMLPSDESRFGGRFFSDASLNFDISQNAVHVKEEFDPYGRYFEKESRFGLRCFALPISIDSDKTPIAYMVVGPIILNKKLNNPEYEKMARDFCIEEVELISEISNIRVVSNLMIKSILDLLYEITENNVKLRVEEESIDKTRAIVGEKNSDAGREICGAVHLDELLISFLDIALKITGTECGSILLLDDDRKNLILKVSKGLKALKNHDFKIKVGEGISGIAVKEETSFFINAQSHDNRIAPLLNRPEIKESVVFPLTSKNQIIGVLNLHTKREKSRIGDNLEKLNSLSDLLSSAI